MRYDGQRGDVAPLKRTRPRARRREAHDGADERGLAHAVAAEDGQHLARRHAERDALEHVAVAVVGVDVGTSSIAGSRQPRGRSPAPCGSALTSRAGRRR